MACEVVRCHSSRGVDGKVRGLDFEILNVSDEAKQAI